MNGSRGIRRGAVFVAGLLLLASAAGAPGARAEGAYAVSGTITDAGTGLPIAGAVVISDGETATSDEAGHYTVRLWPSTLMRPLMVKADLYYTPPKPTEVLVTDSDISGVDFALKRDRARVLAPHLNAVTVRAAPGQTVTIDLARSLELGSYPLFSLEFGVPNFVATAPGARTVLDHHKRLRVGTVTFSGSRLTFTAAKGRPARGLVNIMVLDPSNFGSGADLNLRVMPRDRS